MPTYEYQCTQCGHTFDAVQSFSDDALTECPECGGKLKKLFGNVGIAFKGSGFYRNDSRSGGKSSPSSTANPPSSSSSSNGGNGNGSSDSSSSSDGAAKTSTTADSSPSSTSSSSSSSD